MSNLKDKIVEMRKKEEELFFSGEGLFDKYIKPYFENVRSKGEYLAAKKKFRIDTKIITELPSGVDLKFFTLRQTLRQKYPELWN